MGMYTEFHLNVELIKDVPLAVIEALNFMLANIDDKPEGFPNIGERAEFMLLSDSYYFSMVPGSILKHDDMNGCYYLSVRSNLKNYDNEIDRFVEWLTPYIDETEGTFIGFKRYEEYLEPTLLYHPNTWETVTRCSPSGEKGGR